jgi:hypothetical protein
MKFLLRLNSKNKVSKPYHVFLTSVENTYLHNTKPYYLTYDTLQLCLGQVHVIRESYGHSV